MAAVPLDESFRLASDNVEIRARPRRSVSTDYGWDTERDRDAATLRTKTHSPRQCALYRRTIVGRLSRTVHLSIFLRVHCRNFVRRCRRPW